ncbi:MAG: VOC family protein [Bacteroidia bacterium]|nr:VOC family protein [Bacteroidia bacterium]
MRFAHTNIISDDWRTLVDFYIQVFDCELVPPVRDLQGEWLARGTSVANAALQGAHLRLPGHGPHGPTLEIFQYAQNLPSELPVSNRKGLGHLAFEVENVEATVNQVVAHGGSRYGETVQREVPGAGWLTFTYVRDPEGNIIEIQHWD